MLADLRYSTVAEDYRSGKAGYTAPAGKEPGEKMMPWAVANCCAGYS